LPRAERHRALVERVHRRRTVPCTAGYAE